MRRVGKQVDELDVGDGPAMLVEDPGVVREGFRVAGDVINCFQRNEAFKEALQFLQAGAGRVEHQRFGIDIPEADYAGLTTLDTMVSYLVGKLPP